MKSVKKEKQVAQKKLQMFQAEKLKKRSDSQPSSKNDISVTPLEKKDSLSVDKSSYQAKWQEKIINHKFMHAVFPEEVYPFLWVAKLHFLFYILIFIFAKN